MDDPKNIDEVILILQRERPVLTKDKSGQVGNQKTRYADLVQVNAVVLGRLNELDTIWVCLPHIEAGVFGLHYQLRHVPSSTEKAGVWPLTVSQNPQQMGSGTSYGRRYALLSVTGIVSDEEDDDGQAASGVRTAQRATAQPAAQQTAARARPPLPREANPDARRRHMMAEFGRTGFNDPAKHDEMLARVGKVVGHPVASRSDLTAAEVDKVLAALAKLPDARPLLDLDAIEAEVAAEYGIPGDHDGSVS